MMSGSQGWSGPVIRVQELSVSGIRVIPEQYVKKLSDRPSPVEPAAGEVSIPVIDIAGLYSSDVGSRLKAAALIDEACREWGIFQLVNHGVSHEVMARCREAWREFFQLAPEEKEKYANSPETYEGYGSLLGVEKGISLDWCDYFFLHYLPLELRNEEKWPSLPASCRKLVGDYCSEVYELCDEMMKIFTANLGLRENYLVEAFGGAGGEACMRVNYYPKCPQPDLALGLSPHSDPGGLTVLCPDDNVSGLQVRHGDNWITVDLVPNALIVNLGDQLQILSNANYTSVEHRVVVNSAKERVSMAFFYNPKGEMVIKPAEELVTTEQPPRYAPTKYSEYREYVRMKGPRGKVQVESHNLDA